MIKCFTCFTEMITYDNKNNTIKCKCPKCGSNATIKLNNQNYFSHIEWSIDNNVDHLTDNSTRYIDISKYPECAKNMSEGIKCLSYINGKCARIGGVCINES